MKNVRHFVAFSFCYNVIVDHTVLWRKHTEKESGWKFMEFTPDHLSFYENMETCFFSYVKSVGRTLRLRKIFTISANTVLGHAN